MEVNNVGNNNTIARNTEDNASQNQPQLGNTYNTIQTNYPPQEQTNSNQINQAQIDRN